MEECPLVFKFGGAVLRSLNGFRVIGQRIREHSNGQPLLVVVSALGQVTRELERAAFAAEAGQEETALEIASYLVKHHQLYAEQLLGGKHQRTVAELLAHTAAQLEGYLRGVRITGELTPRTLDAIRAFGERWALALVEAFLQEQGLDVVSVDATELLCTDAQHGKAQPLVERTAQNVEYRLRPLLQPGCIVLTQGFVARSTRGDITTMGQESSSLTAVLLAGLVGAREVQLWTDVAGIRECDPALVPEACLIPQLSYAQAQEIAHAGLRLLHPRMVELAERWGLCLRIRSAFVPELGETVVSTVAGQLVPLVVSREQLRLLAFIPGEVPETVRAQPVDGGAILARWEEAERVWVLISSDIPLAASVSPGALVTVLYTTRQQRARLVELCGQLLQEGIPMQVWGCMQRLRCFVPEEYRGNVVQSFWSQLRRESLNCTKVQEPAS
ncbi:MAG: hypothetical protein NZ473_03950 [Candidatus Kapabacteria bacterium]|nr:hypothetical protein [Candidatus Kapabacteria bacterium]